MAIVTFDIPDEVLRREGLDQNTMRVELACRLFDAMKLSKSEAARMCGLTRDEFDAELVARGLPVIRYTREMWEQDRTHFAPEQGPVAGGDSN